LRGGAPPPLSLSGAAVRDARRRERSRRSSSGVAVCRARRCGGDSGARRRTRLAAHSRRLTRALAASAASLRLAAFGTAEAACARQRGSIGCVLWRTRLVACSPQRSGSGIVDGARQHDGTTGGGTCVALCSCGLAVGRLRQRDSGGGAYRRTRLAACNPRQSSSGLAVGRPRQRDSAGGAHRRTRFAACSP
jgi:hypothetical protein